MKIVAASLLFAFLLWVITFVIKPINFWMMMSLNTLLLSAIALTAGKIKLARPSVAEIAGGILSAVLLYGLFQAGNQVLILFSQTVGIFDQRAEHISSIYASRQALPPAAVALLLFFPIGFGEELYWRGYVQYYSGKAVGTNIAWAGTIILYTAVHFCTGNPVLILAALVCGVYWGTLYRFSRSLWLVLISHMIWDPLIFVINPIL